MDLSIRKRVGYLSFLEDFSEGGSMGKLLDYAEQLDEIVRLVQNDGYSVNEAIKIVKERSKNNE